MSTPKTPMERAKEYEDKHTIKSEYGGDSCYVSLGQAYLVGYSDGAAIQKDKNKVCFAEWWKENEHVYGDEEAYVHTSDAEEIWTAARADRQELVACVLEMAGCCERGISYALLGQRITDILDKHADLIRKLKAEVAK